MGEKESPQYSASMTGFQLQMEQIWMQSISLFGLTSNSKTTCGLGAMG